MAAAPVLERVLTLEDFEQIPDAGKRYELEYGRLVEVAPVGNEQSFLAAVMIQHILDHLGPRPKGAVFDSAARFRLARDPDLIRGPDVSYVPRDRLPPRPWPNVAMDVVPALAVEIVSSSNTAEEIETKVDEYLAAGVDLVWVVHSANERVYVHDSSGNVQVRRRRDTLDGGIVLPGFNLPLEDLFGVLDG